MPLYLICQETASVMKEYNLSQHYTSKLSKFENFKGYEQDSLLQSVRSLQAVFRNAASSSEGKVRASYAMSKRIAINSKPFSDGDFVKKCTSDATKFVCSKSVKDFEKSVTKHDYQKSGRACRQCRKHLKEKLHRSIFYFLAADDSTDLTDTAQLTIFFRGIDGDFNVIERANKRS